MNDLIIYLAVIILFYIIFVFLILLASFIENLFFTLRIRYSNDIQKKNIINFLKQYHLKYSRMYYEIRLEKGFLSVIEHLLKYRKLRRFFNGPQILENAYFQVLYETNSITVINKHTYKSIIDIHHEDEIWEFVIDNISEFFDENQLIYKLEELGYITDKQAAILKTDNKSKSYKSEVNQNEQNNYERNKRKILNVNNCSTEQFDSLLGITFIIAKKLVEYRSNNDGFKNVAEFWDVSGLSMRQRIMIEKVTVIKAKKLKHKYKQTDKGIILRTLERIVDL